MKKFLAGVGKLYAYNSNDDLLFSSKTQIDNSIDITTSNQEIRAGEGAPLVYNYVHSSGMTIKATESQFDLEMIASNIGADLVTGASVWTDETVTITANAGSVTGTPIATSSGYIYGWASLSDGTTEKFTFSGSDFTLTGQSSGTVCVRYFESNSAARQLTVSANIIPAVVRLVLEANLFSGDSTEASGSTKIGTVTIEVPRAQLTAKQPISMTATGVSNTPLEFMALVDTTSASCTDSGVYAYITETISSSHWYDSVTMLSVTDDSLTIATGNDSTLQVYAIPSTGSAFIAPVADLTFSSSATSVATVTAHGGVITAVGAGSAIVSVDITSKSTVTTQIDVTVT